MAVTPGGSLFWRRYTRKPQNSLLKTCQQNTWITGTMSYGLMRWILICLVLMASSMCDGDQVRTTKMCHAYSQAWWWECYGLRLHGCCRCWRVIFHWGNMNSNMYCEILQQSMIPSLQKLGSRAVFQYDNDSKHTSKTTIALLKRLRVKLAKHVSWLEPNRTSLGYPQAEGGGVQSLKYLPALRRRHGGLEEHSSGYPWSSDKLHAQESKGSSG